MVELDRMLRELKEHGFVNARDGRPLDKLHYSEMIVEHEKLLESREATT
jgi:hypothetical protein